MLVMSKWLLLIVLALFSNICTTNAAALVDFQVAQPPPLPKDAKQCPHFLIVYVRRSLYAFELTIAQAYLWKLVRNVSVDLHLQLRLISFAICSPAIANFT